MNYLGLALIAGGVAWWFFTRTPRQTTDTDLPDDWRSELFECYLTLHDHISDVGTPEQKAALLVILPCVAQKDPATDA